MKKKMFLTILLMVSFVPNLLAQTQITEQQAFQLVQNYRTGQGITQEVPCYSATVNSLINDYRCPIATMPVDLWATSTQAKWLIFVDEEPQKAWGHNCTYYYLPKEYTNMSNVPILCYQGILPPEDIELYRLNLLDKIPVLKPFNIFPNQQGQNAPALGGVEEGADVRAIIVVDDGSITNDHIYRKNEVTALYNILLQAGVPKSHIDVFSSLSDNDFDGDGIDDRSTWVSYESRINSFRSNPPSHLIFYYAGYVIPLITWTSYPDTPILGNYYIGDIPEVFSSINAENMTFVLSCQCGFDFAPYFTGNKRVIIAAESEANDSIGYFVFPYKLLSALCGRDINTGNPINSDLNGDGKTSFEEATLYADSVNFADIYYSQPTNLGNQLTLNQMPSHSIFSIDQGFDDQHQISWNSPNIWVRATDDGLENQESECITVSEGSKVFIYVKMAVGGTAVYNSGKYLDLWWDSPHLRLPEHLTNPTETDFWDMNWAYTPPNYLASVPISGPLSSGDTIIVKYRWTVPSSLVQACEPLGGILAVNLGAMVSSYNYWPDDTKYCFDKRMVQKNLVTIEYDKLPTKIDNSLGGQYNIFSDGKLPIIMYNEEKKDIHNDTLNIRVLADPLHSTGNAFSTIQMGIEVSETMSEHTPGPNLHNMTQDASTLTRYRMLSTNSYMSNIYVRPGTSDTLAFYFHGPYAFTAPIDQTFHLISPWPSMSYGQAIRIKLGEENVGPVQPGIHAIPGSNGAYTLTETNVEEPARYEWFGSELNKLSEGKTITANAEDLGNMCIVKVTRQSDGREKYAITQLDNAPVIASVSPVPMGSSLTICLTGEAVDGMMVRIYPVSGGLPIEQMLIAGQSEAVINTGNLLPGYYVVALMRNGQVLQSLQVVK